MVAPTIKKMTDGCAAVTVTTLDRRGRRSLQSKRITDGGSICDQNVLGRPQVAPTIKKMIDGCAAVTVTTLDSRGRLSLQSEKMTDDGAVVIVEIYFCCFTNRRTCGVPLIFNFPFSTFNFSALDS